jgi:hypothetical protein
MFLRVEMYFSSPFKLTHKGVYSRMLQLGGLQGPQLGTHKSNITYYLRHIFYWQGGFCL